MKIGFFRSTKDWCVDFAVKFQKGAALHGDEVKIVGLDHQTFDGWDAACILGIGYFSTWDRVQNAPVPMVYLDKGFTRTGEYNYASIGTYRPSGYLGRWKKPADRRSQFGWNPKPWRRCEPNTHILIAGSSFKYHQFHRLPEPHIWRDAIISELRRHTSRPILFRPKPNQPMDDTWHLVDGTVKVIPERRSIQEDLIDCHAVVLHGSSVGLDALLAGIPAIVVGDAITKSISGHQLYQVEDVPLASLTDRLSLLNDLAYSQWSLTEYENGIAWATIRPELARLVEQNERK